MCLYETLTVVPLLKTEAMHGCVIQRRKPPDYAGRKPEDIIALIQKALAKNAARETQCYECQLTLLAQGTAR